MSILFRFFLVGAIFVGFQTSSKVVSSQEIVLKFANSIGTVHPVKKITEMAHEKGAKVFVDGAQSVGMIPVKLANSNVDAYSMSPHKWLQSPKGTGMFYVNETLRNELPRMWYKTPANRQYGSARKYEDYSTRAWPAAVSYTHLTLPTKA